MPKRSPIKHWSHSSLMSFLRNPLAWYKRYVEGVRDTPSNPASFVGRAGHVALQNFYSLPVRDRTQTGGLDKEKAIEIGLKYLRNVPDFEINFGKAVTRRLMKKRRQKMEKEYLQAISFYLERPPQHKVLGVEFVGMAEVKGLSLPLKAVSDLVVESRVKKGAIDIIDHKFVDNFSMQKGSKGMKTLFALQAIFNYYTVSEIFKKPVARFVVYECKKKRNRDGSAQMRKYVLNFADCEDDFRIFHKLVKDATTEISRKRLYLPNPSDMFEGENSFDIYRMGLVDEE